MDLREPLHCPQTNQKKSINKYGKAVLSLNEVYGRKPM